MTRRAERLAGLLAVAAAVWLTQRGLPGRPYFSNVDLFYFIANPNLWNLSRWPSLFTGAYGVSFSAGGFYHPLPCALYMAFAQAFGPDPWAFRLFQIALLAATAALIGLGERRRLGPWAWLAALLFVFHPMNASLQIVGVRDQLVVFLFLAGVALRRFGAARKGAAFTALPAAAFALALLSKETAVVFPLILLADDWADGRLDGRASGVYAACLAILAAYAAFRRAAFPGTESFQLLLGYAPGETPAVVLRRGLEFLARAGGGGFFPWASAALIAGTATVAARSRRLAAYYGAWLAAGLVFYSGLLPIRNLSLLISLSSQEPHRLFVPAAGVVLLVALAFREARGRAASLVLPAVLLAVFAASARSGFAADWFETASHWSETLPALSYGRRHAPEWNVRYRAALERNFGSEAAALEEYYDGALEDPCRAPYLLRTLSASGDAELMARVEAGLAYRRGAAAAAAGQWTEAEAQYRKATELDADHAAAWRGLAAALWRARRAPEAVEAAVAAERVESRKFYLLNARCANPGGEGLAAELARVDPDAGADGARTASALRAASVFRRSGQYRRAFDLLEPLAAARPADFDVRLELSDAQRDAGRREDAAKSLALARTLASGPGQLRRLAERLQDAGDYPGAVALLRDLTREHPADAGLFAALGVAEDLSGDPEAAARDLETAIRLDPRPESPRVSLAAVRAELERKKKPR